MPSTPRLRLVIDRNCRAGACSRRFAKCAVGCTWATNSRPSLLTTKTLPFCHPDWAIANGGIFALPIDTAQNQLCSSFDFAQDDMLHASAYKCEVLDVIRYYHEVIPTFAHMCIVPKYGPCSYVIFCKKGAASATDDVFPVSNMPFPHRCCA